MTVRGAAAGSDKVRRRVYQGKGEWDQTRWHQRRDASPMPSPADPPSPARPVVAGQAGLTYEQIARTTARAHAALRLVCASLPHLAGLAHAVRVTPDTRVPTAAIAASGRLLVNPDFVAG